MRYGDRREPAEFGDPDALLARFEPGPGRVARLVLHPRLSVVPAAASDYDRVRASFSVGAASRIITGEQLRTMRDEGLTAAERAAVYDEAIDDIVRAREARDNAYEQAAAAERRLALARERMDRVARQRAEADEAVAAAYERLAALEAAETEADLRRALERAASDAEALSVERALDERARADTPTDPHAEAQAIRAQINALLTSLEAASAERAAELADAEEEAEGARRAAAAVERQLALALERVEPSGDRRDVDDVLDRLRKRRAMLTDDGGASDTTRLLRDVAEEAEEPILVLVDPAIAPARELVDAAVSVSELKRVVVVTENTEVLQAARTLDPVVGALRLPLETGGTPRQVLAQSDGNRT